MREGRLSVAGTVGGGCPPRYHVPPPCSITTLYYVLQREEGFQKRAASGEGKQDPEPVCCRICWQSTALCCCPVPRRFKRCCPISDEMEALRARVLSRQLKVAALPSSRELRNLFARDDNQGPRSPSLRSTAPPSTIAMVSISRSIPTTTPRAAPPHYQSFLTPILHRRFVWSCSVGFCVCYIEAFLISSKSSCSSSMLIPLARVGLTVI